MKFVDEFKRKEVNIIILTSFEPLARAVICAAYKKVIKIYFFCSEPWPVN